ncbi:multidrug efflux SMR transporter [Campylobacter sp. faydin G-24]|uniref:Multidrug efflux SMR transporter n=1 Tax=Campylobacter anatolicus TaxID=2829105 RepID=A0ABS5HG69_9BACT|nr:SMR family transporter [Campylobacter anatolicus]MBR8463274.1 multidrug efflux SMR transporter [Campylobacter anatolicus]MBR8465412.1 multidrug efflux SMR transporter [Campylobacter anatolicus]
MSWLLVVAGGIVEIFWVSGLKHSDTLFLYTLTLLGIMFSFIAMIIACKYLEVSIVYSVFVGIGAGGVVLSEMIFFNELFSVPKIILITILMIGVIGLKLTSKENDEKVMANLSDELGLDEIANEFSKEAK